MSKIRDDAECLILDAENDYAISVDDAVVQTKRAMLLEKAYLKLAEALEIGQRDCSDLLEMYNDGEAVERLKREAAELYKQAEDL